ncbi:hypothetical protein B296_00041452 [Ensete ventricosum]|uniref:Uncharacterized protein n=1 Tax=Ensete ventricosum TaxID=4639 RepID=A0A426ZLT2_ENSVE|nr:hypothetical protein B296_00041452 [Ensete ventricosum]
MQACVRFKLSAVARRGRVIPTTSSFPPFPVQHVIDRGGPSCLAFCKLTSGPLCCPTHGNAHIRPKQDLKVTRSSDRVDFISCHSRPKQDLKVTRSSDRLNFDGDVSLAEKETVVLSTALKTSLTSMAMSAEAIVGQRERTFCALSAEHREMMDSDPYRCSRQREQSNIGYRRDDASEYV